MFLINFIFFLNCFLYIKTSTRIDISINEEIEPNQIIGNLLTNLTSLQKYQSNIIFRTESEFVRIKPNGNIILKRKIDLENLCPSKKLCCGVDKCVIIANIIVSDQNEFFDSIHLNLEIVDIDDFKPVFINDRHTISISESSPINYSLTLDSAIDQDFSKINRIINYKYEESSDTFQLVMDKFPQISLRLVKKLDFETVNKYSSILKACDRNRCTNKMIFIDVLDENDNPPIFTQKVYRVAILENLDIGSFILTVHATDLDSGDRGQIYYSISSMDTDLKQTFIIDTRGGHIRLERNLAANVRKSYSFDVIAEDGDRVNSLTDKAKVEVDIIDVNNYHPTITILSGIDRIEIRENSPANHLCSIRVNDLDIGNNSLVDCLLDSAVINDFKLISKSKNIFSLSSARPFDYEVEKLKSARIICTDKGIPPKTADRNILVYITDVNEYRPVFKQPTYERLLMENSETNQLFLQIQATDRDEASVLRYSIDQKGSQYFNIDPKTGWIKTTNIRLDREEIETIIFNAYATDALVDPFTSTAKIIVTIGDQNDNAPIFGLIPKFSILENQISSRLQGQITATDADKGKNAELEFVLWKTWARQQDLQRIFLVSADGYVETLQSLDRETFASYTLEVGVRDMGQYPLATSVNITVTVIDQNDNRPQWLMPSALDPIINITEPLKTGHIIATVRAFDPDEGNNGRIRYKIKDNTPLISTEVYQNIRVKKQSKAKSNNVPVKFTIDSENGELRWLGKDLTEVSDSEISKEFPTELTLIASDNGTPEQKYTKVTVQLLYNPPRPIDIQNKANKTPSATVIVILIAATGFISIVLVVSIICVRKRPLAHPLPPASVLNSANFGNNHTKYSSCPGPGSYIMNKNGSVLSYPYINDNYPTQNGNQNYQAEWNFQDDFQMTNGALEDNSHNETINHSQLQLNNEDSQNNLNMLSSSRLGIYQNPCTDNRILTSPSTFSNIRMRSLGTTEQQIPTITSSRTSYEPIDNEESGDSGKGPSEDIRNGSYLDPLFARNYSIMQWKIPSPIPSSSCNPRQLYSIQSQSQLPAKSTVTTPCSGEPPYNFSLPRSPDYYLSNNHNTNSNTNISSNVQSIVYDSPDAFASELELSTMQQSNI